MSRPMKDSGIAWVNKIPSDWDIHPLYYYFAERNRPNRRGKENNLLSLSYGKIIKKDINTCEGLLPASYNSYNIIDPLDIVLRLTDLQNDKRSLRTGLSHERGIITSAYVTLKPSRQVCPAFFHYLLHAYDVEKVLYNMGNGVRQSLNYAELSKLPLIEPPIPEQQRIAEYLDKKCAEIDTLSNSIQQQIDTLEQYKRAVITETVTKGLHPSAPMKDSGIPWIGKIPQHWNMLKIKYIAKSNQKSLSEKTNPDYQINYIDIGSVSERKGIETYEEIQFSKAPSRARRIVKSGDCIVSTVRTYLKAIAFIDAQFDNYVVSTGFSVLTPMKQFLVNKYLFFLLKNHPLISAISAYSTGVNYPAISDSVLVNLKMPIPPKNEQQSIANYLDEKCSKIDAIIQDKQQQLKKLEQYKEATIFEYVTGKKQVPEA